VCLQTCSQAISCKVVVTLSADCNMCRVKLATELGNQFVGIALLHQLHFIALATDDEKRFARIFGEAKYLGWQLLRQSPFILLLFILVLFRFLVLLLLAFLFLGLVRLINLEKISLHLLHLFRLLPVHLPFVFVCFLLPCIIGFAPLCLSGWSWRTAVTIAVTV